MWARIVEGFVGLWLMASPYIFTRSTRADVAAGVAVMVLTAFSLWRRSLWARFGVLGVAIWLVGTGYLSGYPAPPDAQNRIMAGLLLAMFAVIPNDANRMPAGWQRFYRTAVQKEQENI